MKHLIIIAAVIAAGLAMAPVAAAYPGPNGVNCDGEVGTWTGGAFAGADNEIEVNSTVQYVPPAGLTINRFQVRSRIGTGSWSAWFNAPNGPGPGFIDHFPMSATFPTTRKVQARVVLNPGGTTTDPGAESGTCSYTPG